MSTITSTSSSILPIQLPLRLNQSPQPLNYSLLLNYKCKNNYPIELIFDFDKSYDIRKILIEILPYTIPRNISILSKLENLKYMYLGDIKYKNIDSFKVVQKKEIELTGILTDSIKLNINEVYVNNGEDILNFNIKCYGYNIGDSKIYKLKENNNFNNNEALSDTDKHNLKIDAILNKLGLSNSTLKISKLDERPSNSLSKPIQSTTPNLSNNSNYIPVFHSTSISDDSTYLFTNFIISINESKDRLLDRIYSTKFRGLYNEVKNLSDYLNNIESILNQVIIIQERYLCAQLLKNWSDVAKLRGIYQIYNSYLKLDDVLKIQRDFTSLYDTLKLSDLRNILNFNPPLLEDAKNKLRSIINDDHDDLPFSGFHTEVHGLSTNNFTKNDATYSTSSLPATSQLLSTSSSNFLSFIPPNSENKSNFEIFSSELSNMHVPIEILNKYIDTPNPYNLTEKEEDEWFQKRIIPIRDLFGSPVLYSLFHGDANVRTKSCLHLKSSLAGFLSRAQENEERIASEYYYLLIFKSYAYILATLLQDVDIVVYSNGLILFHSLIVGFQSNIPKSEFRNICTPLLFAILQKSFTGIQERELSMAMVLNLTSINNLGPYWIAGCMYTDEEELISLDWRGIIVRLYILQQIVTSYCIKEDTPLSIKYIMSWCSLCLLHKNSYVRNGAIALAHSIEHFDPTGVEPFLQKLLPSAMSLLSNFDNDPILKSDINTSNNNLPILPNDLFGPTPTPSKLINDIKEKDYLTTLTLQEQLNTFSIKNQLTPSNNKDKSNSKSNLMWSL